MYKVLAQHLMSIEYLFSQNPRLLMRRDTVAKATLRLERKFKFTAMFNAFDVYVNGRQIGQIGNAETKEFVVPTGDLVIQVTFESLGFTIESSIIERQGVKEGETIRVGCVSRMNIGFPTTRIDLWLDNEKMPVSEQMMYS